MAPRTSRTSSSSLPSPPLLRVDPVTPFGGDSVGPREIDLTLTAQDMETPGGCCPLVAPLRGRASPGDHVHRRNGRPSFGVASSRPWAVGSVVGSGWPSAKRDFRPRQVHPRTSLLSGGGTVLQGSLQIPHTFLAFVDAAGSRFRPRRCWASCRSFARALRACRAPPSPVLDARSRGTYCRPASWPEGG